MVAFSACSVLRKLIVLFAAALSGNEAAIPRHNYNVDMPIRHGIVENCERLFAASVVSLVRSLIRHFSLLSTGDNMEK